MKLADIKPRNETEMRWHLGYVHGLYVDDVKTETGLRECHREEHTTGFASHAVMVHDHGAQASGSQPGERTHTRKADAHE